MPWKLSQTELNMPNLLPHHKEMLAASAISPEHEVAKARGYRSMASRHDFEELEALGFSKQQCRLPGLLIPLYNVHGEAAGYQYRPDDPRLKTGKPIKYESPRGQRNILDINPLFRQKLRKSKEGIFITEGAKKADALATIGLTAINLSGVYGWRGKNEEGGRTALPDWEDIGIKENRFVLAFDSDLLTKKQVFSALKRLKAYLESRGADRVRILVVPPLLTGKTGVDDYIHEKGPTPSDIAKLIIDDLPSPNLSVEDRPELAQADVPPLDKILQQVKEFIEEYVVMTVAQLHTVTLWIAHTHSFSAAETTLYLSVRSAEKRSGKTRLLEVVELLVPKPVKTENISVAALVRLVDDGCTMLLDEVDSVFGKGRASETQEMLRGILNSGFRRGGTYTRMQGQGANMSPRSFNTFGPKMLSGIGELPGTLNDRSVPLVMKRKLKTDEIQRFRFREAREKAGTITLMLRAWGVAAAETLASARPEIPNSLNDRAADGWEPILAIADMAGSEWPGHAREAALALSCGEETEDTSIGVKLLHDIHYVFRQTEKNRIASTELLAVLNGMEESPWGGWTTGNGINARSLARILRLYGIKPHSVRLDEVVAKGYALSDFDDAFNRYLNHEPVTEVTSVTPLIHPNGGNATQGEHYVEMTDDACLPAQAVAP